MSWVLNTKYLSDKQIKGFDKYKYNAVDTSPLSVYVMHPFWNAVVKTVPMWVAPNLLTFTGFVMLIVNYILLSYLDWSFCASSREHPDYPPIPWWVWFLSGSFQFLAHTLDGIDGKQARRTGSSTPLGELFDHGSDSVVAAVLPPALYCIFGRGATDYGASVWTLYWVCWHIIGCFALSHWEKYLTGVLYLPWGYDISQVSISIVYLITAVCGYEIWKGTYAFGFEFRWFFLAAVYGGSCFFFIPISLYNIYRSYRDGTGKNRGFIDAAEPTFPFVILFITSTTWAVYSPSDILDVEPRLFCLVMGLLLSNAVCRLIICQMTDTRASRFNWLLLPYVRISVLSIAANIGNLELVLLYALTVLVVCSHVHFGVNVVRQLCDYFKIYCFSITSKPPKNHERTK
ncbi:LOW QUALITY PROTEIN: ethanolaminephosphotransferase 1-like [Amphiura filiformis]|uniref:LOW QUALITY PROTEIN: ethanolaminephosphotransferase 1-like n=1 Tax=Amphiura filiformis TaxID=82378 RepID=UPI003B22182F